MNEQKQFDLFEDLYYLTNDETLEVVGVTSDMNLAHTMKHRFFEAKRERDDFRQSKWSIQQGWQLERKLRTKLKCTDAKIERYLCDAYVATYYDQATITSSVFWYQDKTLSELYKDVSSYCKENVMSVVCNDDEHTISFIDGSSIDITHKEHGVLCHATLNVKNVSK